MHVLMLTWEFPPYIFGGLGVAVFGMKESLASHNTKILIATPRVDKKMNHSDCPNCELIEIPLYSIGDHIFPSVYGNPGYSRFFKQYQSPINQFAANAIRILKNKRFDLIHAHDWLTIPAGIELKHQFNKPLIVHIHSTEFDRSGLFPNQEIIDIEQTGLWEADRVIAVSEYTRQVILNRYQVDPAKVAVVHNGLPDYWIGQSGNPKPIEDREKIVVFLGRLTMQKGPDYFIKVAKRVLEVLPKTRFVIAGRGDMEGQLIEEAIAQGIKSKLIFTGFLSEHEVNQLFKETAVYVMPSLSEPFGITALEAMAAGTPVIISRNAGVTEIAKHVLKVDFWDIDQMASKIIAVLSYPKTLGKELQDNSLLEIKSFHWSNQTKKIIKHYWAVLRRPIISW